MDKKILICHWPLNRGIEVAKDVERESPDLIKAIEDFYYEQLLPKGEELFEKMNNVIVTNKAYYGAFFEDDLEHTEK